MALCDTQENLKLYGSCMKCKLFDDGANVTSNMSSSSMMNQSIISIVVEERLNRVQEILRRSFITFHTDFIKIFKIDTIYLLIKSLFIHIFDPTVG